jgi:hypothetical protein
VIKLVEMLIKAVEMQNLLHFATHAPKISSILYVSAHAHKTSNAKGFAFVAYNIFGFDCQRMINAHKSRRTHTRVSTQQSAHAHKIENILDM